MIIFLFFGSSKTMGYGLSSGGGFKTMSFFIKTSLSTRIGECFESFMVAARILVHTLLKPKSAKRGF